MSLTLACRHNVDRFGYLIPHRYGNLPMVGAVATYRPGEGRFGGDAIAVEEATENLWEADTQWTDYQLGTSLYDHPVPRAILDNLGSHVTVSYEARVTSGPNVNMQVYVRSTDGTVNTYNKNPQLVEVGPEWTRVEQSVQIDNRSIDRYVWLARDPVGQVIDIRRFQVEAKPFATSFVNGTRAAGRLYVPESVWNPAQGTFACWAKSNDIGGDYRHLTMQWAKNDPSAASLFSLSMLADGKMRFTFGTAIANAIVSPISTDDGEWHHYAATWVNGTKEIHLYVDGVKVASESVARTISNPGGRWNGGIPIGHRGYSYNNQWWNGLIDELLILPYAASEEEIASWYEAQGPLPPHPQASLQWDWQTVRPVQMVKL